MPDSTPASIEMRPFPLPGLLAQVNTALAMIPPDEPVAVVGAADEQTAGVYVFVRVAKGLSFMGQLRKSKNTPVSYGAYVVWTPFKGKW